MAIKMPPIKKALPGGNLAGPLNKKPHPEMQVGQASDAPTPDTFLR